jgi:F-type H+-transporting ATPase subunit delta
MSGEVVAGRYANALFQTIADNTERQQAHRALQRVAAIMEEPTGPRTVVLNPFYSRQQREAALRHLVQALNGEGELPPSILRFLLLLLRKNRLNLLNAVAAAFGRLLDGESGRIGITITTAAPLEPAAQTAAKTRLEQLLHRPVGLTLHVDPSLLGGIRLQTGSRLIDGTIRGRLDRLRRLAVEERS